MVQGLLVFFLAIPDFGVLLRVFFCDSDWSDSERGTVGVLRGHRG